MRWAGVLVLFVAAAPGFAYAGAGCFNACTPDPVTQLTCLDNGFGCNPSTRRCEPCFNDAWCAPGGTCQNGGCINVNCDADAGADAGAPADARPDAEPVDAMTPDADRIDAGGLDAGAQPDAGPVDATPVGGRGGRGGVPEKGQYEEECTCRQAHPGGRGVPWLAAVFIGLIFRPRRSAPGRAV